MKAGDSPTFDEYAWVVVNSSAGKDSQTALRQVVLEADWQEYPRDRIVVSHQMLGRMEWPGTTELARTQAEHYGLRFETSQYRNRNGEELTLLDYVKQRRKWPSNTSRFCTSEFKRGPGNRVLTRLSRERRGKILQVFGFRASESPARAKKVVFERDKRASTGVKPVFNWLPIHDWTDREVWEDIRASGVPYHPAYDKGMPRLSCCLCIFSPRGALMLAGRENPELLQEYVDLEAEIGHDFQNGKSLRDVQKALQEGEEIPEITGEWNM